MICCHSILIVFAYWGCKDGMPWGKSLPNEQAYDIPEKFNGHVLYSNIVFQKDNAKLL